MQLANARMRGKSVPHEFLVVGLGLFGQALSRRLIERGHSVLGVDNDYAKVQEASTWLTHAIQLDATSRDALIAVEAQQFATAIVAISTSFEASILATVLLKELGVPHIITRTASPLHEQVLERIGADEIIFPERDAGYSLAERLSK